MNPAVCCYVAFVAAPPVSIAGSQTCGVVPVATGKDGYDTINIKMLQQKHPDKSAIQNCR